MIACKDKGSKCGRKIIFFTNTLYVFDFSFYSNKPRLT